MSNHSHNFPAEYPFDCLLTLVGIIRRGEMVEKKYEAIQHACWFIGCAAAKLAVKSPDLFAASFGDDMPKSLDELADEISSKLAFASTGEEPAEIDPITIIAIIGIVINVIIHLRKNR